jgi:hypothetical protein
MNFVNRVTKQPNYFNLRCCSFDNREVILKDLLYLMGQKTRSGDVVEAYREYYLKFGNEQISMSLLQRLLPVLANSQDKVLLKAAWKGIWANGGYPNSTSTILFLKALEDEISVSEVCCCCLLRFSIHFLDQQNPLSRPLCAACPSLPHQLLLQAQARD